MSKVKNLVGRGVRLIEPTGLADGSSERLVEILPQAYEAKLAEIGSSKLPADIMDFGEVYREARIEPPFHGYGIDKIESMLNHPRLVAIRPEQRAAAVLAALEAAGVEVLCIPGPNARVGLAALCNELGRRGLNEIHVEAGATLNGALLDAGLVDEWIAYLAPLVMGDAARGVFALPPLSDMANRLPFKLLDSRQVGGDLRLTLRPA